MMIGDRLRDLREAKHPSQGDIEDPLSTPVNNALLEQKGLSCTRILPRPVCSCMPQRNDTGRVSLLTSLHSVVAFCNRHGSPGLRLSWSDEQSTTQRFKARHGRQSSTSNVCNTPCGRG